MSFKIIRQINKYRNICAPLSVTVNVNLYSRVKWQRRPLMTTFMACEQHKEEETTSEQTTSIPPIHSSMAFQIQCQAIHCGWAEKTIAGMWQNSFDTIPNIIDVVTTYSLCQTPAVSLQDIQDIQDLTVKIQKKKYKKKNTKNK